MSDRMRPISFGQLMDWIIGEYQTYGSIFGVSKIVRHAEDAPGLPLFGERMEAPFGPAAGLAVGVVGAVIHGILMADFSGAVMNILVVAGFILPAALVYRRSRTFKSGVVGLVLSAITATVMAILGNLVITPMWLGVPLDAVVAMILPILTPFNLIKAGINAVLTLIVYKSISNLITPKKKQVKGR